MALVDLWNSDRNLLDFLRGPSDMPKNIKRRIRILARRADGLELRLGVFAPAIAANLRMIDLRLRKAVSDILGRTFPGILQALARNPEDSQAPFDLVEVGHDGLDHGSPVNLEA
jgi:hypothetical protein